MIEYLLKQQDILSKENVTLNMLEKEKKQCENSLENIMKAIERGIINNTTNKRMKELEEKLEDLEKKLLIEKSKYSVKITENDIREFFIQAIKLEPKLMINYLVKEIILFDDKVEIYFNNPIVKGPDESQGFLLFKAINKMRHYIVNKNCIKLQPIITEIYV